MLEIDDPRVFPDPSAAPAQAARLHALAAASLAAATRQESTLLDTAIRQSLDALLAPGRGAELAEIFATAPSVAAGRHLWRLLAQCELAPGRAGTLHVTVFALPVIVVAGIEGGHDAQATLPCVLADVAALVEILREHRALAGNQSFALANVLVASSAIDLARLPDLLARRALTEAASPAHVPEPAPIALRGGPETVHLRFLVGSALAAPGADLLRDDHVGKWGMPLAQALGRQLAVPGTSVLALPRAPQSLLHALRQGRAAQREVGVQVFAANAIRKLRAAVGEPTAVISAHRSLGADNGGELRLSLSSPFDPREAEGFRCPLQPQESVADVVAILTGFLAECRVTDVRIVPGIHADRDSGTGLTLLFKGDDLPLPPPTH
jgi:hypothetical protein